MSVEKIRFKNIIKEMVNNCEKFANSLERYRDFQDEKTQEEWENIMKSYTQEEIEFIEELNERYYNHLDRVDKMK